MRGETSAGAGTRPGARTGARPAARASAAPAQRFDAALVDLDGTLVDTMGDFVAALQAMLVDMPAPFSSYALQAHVVEPLVGKGSENLIKSLLAVIEPVQQAAHLAVPPAPYTAALFDQAWRSYQTHYQAVNGQHAQLYPGVLEGLQHMKSRGMRLACVTNKPTAFAIELLRKKDLDRFFELTLGGDAFAHKKPHPMPLLKACEALARIFHAFRTHGQNHSVFDADEHPARELAELRRL
jgi:phosphoglycolate phosphatase